MDLFGLQSRQCRAQQIAFAILEKFRCGYPENLSLRGKPVVKIRLQPGPPALKELMGFPADCSVDLIYLVEKRQRFIFCLGIISDLYR